MKRAKCSCHLDVPAQLRKFGTWSDDRLMKTTSLLSWVVSVRKSSKSYLKVGACARQHKGFGRGHLSIFSQFPTSLIKSWEFPSHVSVENRLVGTCNRATQKVWTCLNITKGYRVCLLYIYIYIGWILCLNLAWSIAYMFSLFSPFHLSDNDGLEPKVAKRRYSC
jgi:hypothetical protein